MAVFVILALYALVAYGFYNRFDNPAKAIAWPVEFGKLIADRAER